MTMDSITGSTAINSVFMTGNNNFNTSTDVMATRNMAKETTAAYGSKENNQDVMTAQANPQLPADIYSGDFTSPEPEQYPEVGSQLNFSA